MNRLQRKKHVFRTSIMNGFVRNNGLWEYYSQIIRSTPVLTNFESY